MGHHNAVDWYYDPETGHIIDLYIAEEVAIFLDPSWRHFPGIPDLTEAEIFDQAHADAAAALEAQGYYHYATTTLTSPGEPRIAPPIPAGWNHNNLLLLLAIIAVITIIALFTYHVFWPFIYWLEHLPIFY